MREGWREGGKEGGWWLTDGAYGRKKGRRVSVRHNILVLFVVYKQRARKSGRAKERQNVTSPTSGLMRR